MLQFPLHFTQTDAICASTGARAVFKRYDLSLISYAYEIDINDAYVI